LLTRAVMTNHVTRRPYFALISIHHGWSGAVLSSTVSDSAAIASPFQRQTEASPAFSGQVRSVTSKRDVTGGRRPPDGAIGAISWADAIPARLSNAASVHTKYFHADLGFMDFGRLANVGNQVLGCNPAHCGR